MQQPCDGVLENCAGRRASVLLSLCFGLFLGVLVPALLVLVVDPCHVFHKPIERFFSYGFSPIQRCQNAGLINSYLRDDREGFDSLIVGSSVSENFRPEYVASRAGMARTLKLVMGDAAPLEQNILLRRALASEKVRHVYWEMLPYLYRVSVQQDFSAIESLGRFPAYLYNQSALDDYRYVFDRAVLAGAWSVLQGYKGEQVSIDRIGYWDSECASAGVCARSHDQQTVRVIEKAEWPPEQQLPSIGVAVRQDYALFDRYAATLLRDYCNTSVQFDLFFPPVSLQWFSRLSDAEFEHELYQVRHAVNQVAGCNNIAVHVFFNELSITADMSNYRDPKHFYGGVHDLMVDAMVSGSHQIRQDGVDEFEEMLLKNVRAYRLYTAGR